MAEISEDRIACKLTIHLLKTISAFSPFRFTFGTNVPHTGCSRHKELISCVGKVTACQDIGSQKVTVHGQPATPSNLQTNYKILRDLRPRPAVDIFSWISIWKPFPRTYSLFLFREYVNGFQIPRKQMLRPTVRKSKDREFSYHWVGLN